jgi:hypothetical protein
MVDVLDYKKEYKDLYLPKNELVIITIPEITFVAIEGKGNLNENDGEYKKSWKYCTGYNIQ